MSYSAGNYSLTVSLVHLLDEVNKRWPHRDHWSDGWLGDTAHASRYSDHNPDYPRPPGWVHAVDIDATLAHAMGPGSVGDEVLRSLLRLARGPNWHPINYIIHKGMIWSRSHGFVARRYYGSNQHHSHCHVSILRTDKARFWRGSWGIAKPSITLPRIFAANAVKAFTTKPESYRFTVSRIQRRLVSWGWLVSGQYHKGYVDAKTKDAYKGWQAKHGYKADGVPNKAELTRLAGTTYRVVD